MVGRRAAVLPNLGPTNQRGENQSTGNSKKDGKGLSAQNESWQMNEHR